MATYYEGNAVYVTRDVFATRQPHQQRFQIQDLRDVYVTREEMDRTAVRGFGLTGVLMCLALVVVVSWPVLHTLTALLVAMMVVVTPGLLSGLRHRSHQPHWELRATYRGSHVQLYSTDDLHTFGQVRRALMRALEANLV